MPSKNSRVLSKPSVEPAFIVIFRVLLLIAIFQFLAAAVVLAPRLISTVASQVANKSKATEVAIAGASSSPLANSNKNLALPQENIPENKSASLKLTGQLHPSSGSAHESSSSTSGYDSGTKIIPAANDLGFQPGASLAIIEVQHLAGNDGEHVIKIPIKSRPHEVISVPDVKVQVYFYDQQDGEIVASKSQVASRWLSPPVDWKDPEPELLEVTYQPDNTTPESHYLGYIVAVYYKGELQGYRADPAKLIKQFPVKIYAGSHDL